MFRCIIVKHKSGYLLDCEKPQTVNKDVNKSKVVSYYSIICYINILMKNS